MTDGTRASLAVPAWVPTDVRNYVFHTEMGQPIRALARAQACHASTIMRQVRKVEQRRDDPLVDRAIAALADDQVQDGAPSQLDLMQALRRLVMPDAILAIAIGMENGVVLQDTHGGDDDRGTTLSAHIAQTLALRGWIQSGNTLGRVLRYRITPAGRVALRELVAQTENKARELAEGPTAFEGANGRGTWSDAPTMSRMPSQDSPVVGLARRKDRDGKPFLNRSMVRAAERLREDFEIAQIGQGRSAEDGGAPDWQSLLAEIEHHPTPCDVPPEGARGQVTQALTFLGPGLAEVALRCCCLLEGLETTEKHMGWAARSGKVVLRIALQRLVLHYEAKGTLGPKIG